MGNSLLELASPYLQLSTGVVVTDPDGMIVSCNDEYCLLTGYTQEQLLGNHLLLCSPRGWQDHLAIIGETLHSTGRWSGYLRVARPGGTDWTAHLSITPIEQAGRLLGYVGIISDVTVFGRAVAGHQPSDSVAGLPLQETEGSLIIFQHMVLTISKIAEVRDPDIDGHLERVQTIVRWLLANNDECSWRSEEREWTAVLALLHDIGKIAVPEGILFKPGLLRPEERRLMELHTTIGEDLVRKHLSIPGLEHWAQRAAEIVRWHHERYNGEGYPDRLKGESIPLAARVVAVADVVDALSSRRSYKVPWTWQDVVAYVEEQAGRQFDPGVVRTFRNIEGLIKSLYQGAEH